jgi:hypothetical protein
LRFTRDKRGYENTFVVHSPRRRARGRSRIIYWFRTPPGVRVGRGPLDEDAIKSIEECHPAIRFDWPQILRGEEEAYHATAQDVRQSMTVPSLPAPEPAGAKVDVRLDMPMGPAHAQLGSEGLARLRARYADVMAGISRRVPDPERQEQLRTSAARLNPDNWVTADEVRVGLEEYESVFETLRGLVGRRRRRRRSRTSDGGEGGRPVQPGSADEDGISAGTAESRETEEFDDDAGGPPPAAQD